MQNKTLSSIHEVGVVCVPQTSGKVSHMICSPYWRPPSSGGDTAQGRLASTVPSPSHLAGSSS